MLNPRFVRPLQLQLGGEVWKGREDWVHAIAHKKVSQPFGGVLCRAILANWMVNLAVYQVRAPSSLLHLVAGGSRRGILHQSAAGKGSCACMCPWPAPSEYTASLLPPAHSGLHGEGPREQGSGGVAAHRSVRRHRAGESRMTVQQAAS